MRYRKKWSAKNTHCALGGELLGNRIHLPLAKNTAGLLWASGVVTPPNVTNPSESLTALKGTP